AAANRARRRGTAAVLRRCRKAIVGRRHSAWAGRNRDPRRAAHFTTRARAIRSAALATYAARRLAWAYAEPDRVSEGDPGTPHHALAGAARVQPRPHAQPLVHHSRRSAEHNARADENVLDANRFRHQGGDHRRHYANRSRARPEKRADRR